MNFDLNIYELKGYRLGDKTNVDDGFYEYGSFAICIQNKIIKNIVVRLSEFYSKGEVFKGILIIEDSSINLDYKFQPKDICSYFNDLVDSWDDNVEVNYQFQKDNVLLEFSWHWSQEKLIANYINIELDSKC